MTTVALKPLTKAEQALVDAEKEALRCYGNYSPIVLERGVEDTVWGARALTVIVEGDGFVYRYCRDNFLFGDEMSRETAVKFLDAFYGGRA